MPLFHDENRLITEQSALDNPVIRYLAYGIVVALLSIVQLIFSPIIAVDNIYPNFLLIFCAIIALREGQMVGLVAAFCAGLIYDVISNDVIGTNALASILAIFLVGYFHREGRFRQLVGSYRFLILVLVATLVFNLVYHILRIDTSEVDFLGFFLKYGIASTLYTTVIAILPLLVMARKSDI